jgi:asparagine synthase (glutamine-hydrolysing)
MCGILVYKGRKNFLPLELEEHFSKLYHRGPDYMSRFWLSNVFLGFHRLAIMDPSPNGNQPFRSPQKKHFLLCNGEIYNAPALKEEFSSYDYTSNSDCEVIIPLMLEYGIKKTCRQLDGEFAFVWYDLEKDRLLAARDPIGIRPLFYGTSKDGDIAFASEAKALTDLCYEVKPFPPGHFFDGYKFVNFRSMIHQKQNPMSMHDALGGIKEKLKSGVIKRLQSDVPVGFLLSGGLDSSLVCAIAADHLKKPIKTFSVGSETDAIDNQYAERAAKYMGAEHTTVLFSQATVMNTLNELIRMLETWDVTTIRASIGMYLVCKYIRENTDIKVLLTGEVSDELFGYKYTDFAPSPKEFQKEARKRIKEIHMYDVLRADRCISAHALEARVPFGDLEFVDFVMSIPAEMKMNKYGFGKALLRKAFEGTGLLPPDILYREKAAFSDAVGHSVADGIKEHAENTISDEELREAQLKYKYCTPVFKEALFYRRIFDKHYPKRATLIKAMWLPNRSWENCNVTDPSARELPNYGKSGK